MYASNMSLEERVRLGVIPQECMDIVEEAQQKLIEMEKELNYYKGREELLSEQVYFAREVIGNIQEGVKQARSVGQARQAVEHALAEGYFEL